MLERIYISLLNCSIYFHSLNKYFRGSSAAHAPDIHPGSLRGGGEEDVDDPEGGDVSLAGHGCLDGVLGGQQTELDQLAVTDLES